MEWMEGGGIGKGKGCKRDGLVEGLEFETHFFGVGFSSSSAAPPPPQQTWHRQSWLK